MESQGRRIGPGTVLLGTLGGVLVLAGFWFNVIYSRVNTVTGQETHPYAVLGWVAWLAGLGCFAALFPTTRGS